MYKIEHSNENQFLYPQKNSEPLHFNQRLHMQALAHNGHATGIDWTLAPAFCRRPDGKAWRHSCVTDIVSVTKWLWCFTEDDRESVSATVMSFAEGLHHSRYRAKSTFFLPKRHVKMRGASALYRPKLHG